MGYTADNLRKLISEYKQHEINLLDSVERYKMYGMVRQAEDRQISLNHATAARQDMEKCLIKARNEDIRKKLY